MTDTILAFEDAFAPDFHRINAAWIETMFRLEPTDLDVLLHPRERIVDAGGAILFLETAGEGVIGTVALQQTGERQFELTKMGVTAAAQGRGAGERLLHAALAEAARLGAERLYLLTKQQVRDRDPVVRAARVRSRRGRDARVRRAVRAVRRGDAVCWDG